jgi:two-component sensor histidine kinase
MAQYQNGIKTQQTAQPFARYALLWLFLVIVAGTFSNWIFHLLYEQSIQEKNHLIGYVNAAVFATFYLLSFHVTFSRAIKKYPPVELRNGLIHAGAGVLNIILAMAAGWIVMPFVLSCLKHSGPSQKMALEFGIILLIMICSALVFSGFFYIEWFVKEQYRANQARINSELSALRAQINPHFLFNAMNTIAALIQKDSNRAEEVVLDLADVFRYILQSSRKTLVPLSEEIHLISMYLNIEKARFGDRLTIDLKVSKEAQSCMVPSLLLQPLVENAIKHSIAKVEGNQTLTVTAEVRGTSLLIGVSDTGPGFREGEIAAHINKGTGLTNVQRLLELSYPGQFEMNVVNRGIGIVISTNGAKDASRLPR